jgi:hypothetical protein
VVGVLGASTSVIGSLAAVEVVRWLSKEESSLLGKLLVYDFERLTSYMVPVRRRKSCGTCGSTPSKVPRRKTITLCGAGEYYLPRAFDPATYSRVLAEVPKGLTVRRRGSSVAVVVLPEGVTLALFRKGAVLIKGAGSPREAEKAVSWLPPKL